MQFLAKRQQGFTLVELVTVIVILGVLSGSISTFLRFGTQSYSDASDREALIASARFVIERLNREVRQALPNSIRTIGDNEQCLEFVPIDRSVIYLELPVAPEPASNSLEVVMLDAPLLASTQYAVVYALNSADIYNKAAGVVEAFSSVNNSGSKSTPSQINFASAVLFNAESPTQRLYLVAGPVSYCIENQAIYRYQDYNDGDYAASGVPGASATKVLMAEYLDNYSAAGNLTPFQTFPATLQRNALALVQLKFARNLEEIVFANEIQVQNVP
ncbi:MSHA biogenesis protein MshO [Colwellia chukchiensis]|uniref:MSHA biogenesis protein MshO n=1 Tax=Colwellia chukchiensis TaxID=641665 RepID=A0A1H7L9X5_9GAMM|nr:type II secretion system protein [Colwellia chukchiensis]SEK95728.1 MSHA biogenesis protein MshO [Colwellia chukchiensis]